MSDIDISGLQLLEVPEGRDERGWMRRVFDVDVFGEVEIDLTPRQVSIATNSIFGTLRGLHFQKSPHSEMKLVSCVRGRIFDVVVDLRSDSSTYADWKAFELDSRTPQAVFIPRGCAHGYLTLDAGSEVLYVIDSAYNPASQGGVHWEDPQLNIPWPFRPKLISERDSSLPFLGNLEK